MLYSGRWRSLLVPVCAPTCGCDSPGKAPHRYGWQNAVLDRYESYSEKTAAAHAERMRKHVRSGGNVGLALPPHVAALDVDTDHEGGSDYSKPLARDALLSILDDHPWQASGKTDTGDSTGRRIGGHIFGLCVDRRPYGTHHGQVPVTIRATGNQVVVEPSLHRSGLRYSWTIELPEDPALLPMFDTLMFKHVSKNAGPVERRRDEAEAAWRARVSAAWLAELEDPDVRFAPGRRHEALLWAAWHRIKRGASDEDALAVVLDLAETRCTPDGRFGAAQGTRDRHALEREARAVVRSCRRRHASWR